MPYFGLLDERGHELKARDYKRIDASGLTFRLMPPLELGGHATFVNLTDIKWAAKSNWGKVAGIAIYAKRKSRRPLEVTKFRIIPVIKRDSVGMRPGQLCITHLFTG